MPNQRYSSSLFIFFLMFFLLIKCINAAQYRNSELTEFSLSLQKQKTYFISSTDTYKIELDQIGINWYEAFTTTFQGGLEYGYLDVSLSNNLQPSTQLSSGEYFGILFRYKPIESPIMSLTLNLNYRYNKTEPINSKQYSELLWHKILFSSEVELRPFDKVGILLAAEYQNLSGEQRDPINANQVIHFNADKHIGYRFGINIKANPTSEIRFEWLTGYRKGGGIHFIRGF